MDDRYIEIEPYEEIVDRDEVFSTPSGSRSASPVLASRGKMHKIWGSRGKPYQSFQMVPISMTLSDL